MSKVELNNYNCNETGFGFGFSSLAFASDMDKVKKIASEEKVINENLFDARRH